MKKCQHGIDERVCGQCLYAAHKAKVGECEHGATKQTCGRCMVAAREASEVELENLAETKLDA